MGAVVTTPSTLPDETAPAPVRVLLVDDEALMRTGLRLMIDGAAGISVVGEAADGDSALEQAGELEPDVILMDIRMPRMTGLEALAQLRERGAPARVVMLTAFDTDAFLLEALRGGAVSFLLKDSPPEQVVRAVLDAAHDRPNFSPEVLSRLVRWATDAGAVSGDVAAPGSAASKGAVSGGAASGGAEGAASEGPASGGGSTPHGAAAEPGAAAAGSTAAPSRAAQSSVFPPAASLAPEGLTAREWEVGRLAAQGLTNQEIGQQLFLSLATVKTHLGRLFEKLQVTNRVQLAIRVLELDS